MKSIHEKKYTELSVDYVNEMALTNPKVFAEESEKYYNDQVMAAAKRIKENPNYKVVLLCGPSASGKTTTAHKLKHRLMAISAGAQVVSMDDFFLGIEAYPKLPDGRPDMESVYALDLDLLNHCFGKVLKEGEADFPIYDFTRQIKAKRTKKITMGKDDVLIMEGIHSLNPEVLSGVPEENIFRMYVSVRTKFVKGDETVLVPKDIRLIRRMVRDHKFRNYSPQNTLENWENVLRGEIININPYRDDVDLKMDNTIDYEVCVWHKMLNDLLEEENIAQYSEYPQMKRIFEGLLRFNNMDPCLIPKNSLLREFIGKDV